MIAKLMRNVACVIFVASVVFAFGAKARAFGDVCSHEGCTCHGWGFGWVAECPLIESCDSSYPSFCSDFLELCSWGGCDSGTCWGYCPDAGRK